MPSTSNILSALAGVTAGAALYMLYKRKKAPASIKVTYFDMGEIALTSPVNVLFLSPVNKKTYTFDSRETQPPLRARSCASRSC